MQLTAVTGMSGVSMARSVVVVVLVVALAGLTAYVSIPQGHLYHLINAKRTPPADTAASGSPSTPSAVPLPTLPPADGLVAFTNVSWAWPVDTVWRHGMEAILPAYIVSTHSGAFDIDLLGVEHFPNPPELADVCPIVVYPPMVEEPLSYGCKPEAPFTAYDRVRNALIVDVSPKAACHNGTTWIIRNRHGGSSEPMSQFQIKSKSGIARIDLNDTEVVLIECRKRAKGGKIRHSHAAHVSVVFNATYARRAQKQRKRKWDEYLTAVNEGVVRDESNEPPWPHASAQWSTPRVNDIHKWAPGPPDILVLVLDTISRPNVLRDLPATVAALQALHSSGIASVFDFQRHTVVGIGTRSNAISIYRGVRGAEVASEPQWRKSMPWLWDIMAEHGYVTQGAFGSCPWVRQSLSRLITDHPAGDPTARERVKLVEEASHWGDHSLYNAFCDMMRLGHYEHYYGLDENSQSLCFAGRNIHEHIFDSLTDFFTKYGHPEIGRASFVHLLDGHDTMETRRIRLLDDNLAAFIKQHYATRPSTVMLIVGDHGRPLGKFARTPQGQLEYKLPAMFWTVPNSFLREYPSFGHAMRANTKRVTSQYDVYETLRHLLKPWLPHKRVSHHPGRSLFEPLPPRRSCMTAGVPLPLCPCAKRIAAAPGVPDALAKIAVRHLNDMAIDPDTGVRTKKCFKLELRVIAGVDGIPWDDTPASEVQIKDWNPNVRFGLWLKVGNNVNKESERFEMWYVATNRMTFMTDDHPSWLRVGTEFDPRTLQFQSEHMVIPGDTMNVAWSWPSTAASAAGDARAATNVTVRLFAPKSKADSPPYRTLIPLSVTSDVYVVSTKLTSGGGRAGVWRAVLVADEIVVGETVFGLASKNEMTSDMMNTIWSLETARRTSAYQRHVHCTPANITPEFCVCKIAT